MKNEKNKKNLRRTERIRLVAIILISLIVIATGVLFSYGSFKQGNVTGGILGLIISVIILCFGIIVYKRGNRDLKKGQPLKDERSKRVIEKASSLSFYITLYILLAIGFLSENIINFRDISQATSIGVGLMALLFLLSWVYYNNKEL